MMTDSSRMTRSPEIYTINQTARTRCSVLVLTGIFKFLLLYSNTVETYGEGSTITVSTEREHSPLTKTSETLPSARITPNEETKATEEQSRTETYKLANKSTT